MNMNIDFKDYKRILLYVAVPVLLGAFVGLLTSGGTSNYDSFVPGWIFPVVWTILYILMGLSSYLVRNNEKLINIYKLNLFVNLTWLLLLIVIV